MKKVYENEYFQVWDNGVGELLVIRKTEKEEPVSKTQLRISPEQTDEIRITAYWNLFTPTSKNGLPGFIIGNRR